jgi:lysophospholipase L1-like esterase
MKTATLLFGIFLATCSASAKTLVLPATDARFEWSDTVAQETSGGLVWPNRNVLLNGGKYRTDSPGARFRFRCGATTLSVDLAYGERNAPARAQNGTGVFLVDGVGHEAWRFQRTDPRHREPEAVTVTLPADGRMHDYELVMPYAERVGVSRVTCNTGATFEKLTPRPAFRCAFFGDSVTHGFTASQIDRTYPYRIGTLKNWQALNLGFGGIGTSPRIAEDLARIEMDLLVVALGVNDWQGGTPPETTQANMRTLLDAFRRGKPDVPVVVVTPLWVPPAWAPAKACHALDVYRAAIAQAVAESGDPKTALIAGDRLIDHSPALFDKVAVHPNDDGFVQMAGRLARQLSESGAAPAEEKEQK